MRLFAPDLYRNFAFGFAAGAVLVAGASIDHWGDELASPARAAEAVQVSDDGPAAFLATGRHKAE